MAPSGVDSGVLIAERSGRSVMARVQAGQRWSVRLSAIFTVACWAHAVRHGPCLRSYWSWSACRMVGSVAAVLVRRPRVSIRLAPAPKAPGTLSLRAWASAETASSTVSCVSNRSAIRTVRAASSSARGRLAGIRAWLRQGRMARGGQNGTGARRRAGQKWLLRQACAFVPFLGPRRAVPVADFGVERINTNYFSEGRAPRGVEAFEWQRFMQKPESLGTQKPSFSRCSGR